MTSEVLSFTDRVVVVTGAGRGIGRSHALAFASRGAAVVVNDTGRSLTGDGAGEDPAEAVVREIREGGGVAVANYTSVATPEGAAAVVAHARDEFGRLDVVVSNAGILRDKSLGKLIFDDVRAVVDVHLFGSMYLADAAWPLMREQGFGRIVLTTSNAGLFGNFGQAAYGAAKAGLVGLVKVGAVEGARHGIHVNGIAPMAATRMTATALGDVAEAFDPAPVSAVVTWLAHETCPTTGEIYSVGAGRVAKVVIGITEGYVDADLSPEAVRDHLAEVEAGEPWEPEEAMAELRYVCRRLGLPLGT